MANSASAPGKLPVSQGKPSGKHTVTGMTWATKGQREYSGNSKEQKAVLAAWSANRQHSRNGEIKLCLKAMGCGSGDRGGRASRRGPGTCKVPSTQGILSHTLAPMWLPAPARQFHNRVSFLLVPSGVYASSVQDTGTQNEASEQGGGPDRGSDMASFQLGPGLQ